MGGIMASAEEGVTALVVIVPLHPHFGQVAQVSYGEKNGGLSQGQVGLQTSRGSGDDEISG
jgi:hypothetical protein